MEIDTELINKRIEHLRGLISVRLEEVNLIQARIEENERLLNTKPLDYFDQVALGTIKTERERANPETQKNGHGKLKIDANISYSTGELAKLIGPNKPVQQIRIATGRPRSQRLHSLQGVRRPGVVERGREKVEMPDYDWSDMELNRWRDPVETREWIPVGFFWGLTLLGGTFYLWAALGFKG